MFYHTLKFNLMNHTEYIIIIIIIIINLLLPDEGHTANFRNVMYIAVYIHSNEIHSVAALIVY